MDDVRGDILGLFFISLASKSGLNTDDMHIYSAALQYEPVREKTNNLGSDQVQHKPVCTVTEDG